MADPVEAREDEIRPTGEQIRLVRNALGWSQILFAQTLGVHWSTVLRWERGYTTISPLGLFNYRKLLARPEVQKALVAAMQYEAATRAPAA